MKNTATTAEQGETFLQDLADSDIDSLVHVDFSGGKQVIVARGNAQEFVNSAWFSTMRQKPVDLLVVFLERQTNLKTLILEHCDLSEN